MKKYIKNISILFVSIALISCDDELNDLEPFIQGNPATFFTNEQSFQNGVDGIYSQFFNYYASTTSGYQGIPDILADNVILAQTGRLSNEVIYDFRFTPVTGGAISLYLSEGYEAVNASNLVIGQIDNLPDGAVKDNILGQALAARAIAHFDMVRIYGKIPTQSSDALTSPGIVYSKVEDGDTVDPFALPARETVASNYEEIIEDLVAASNIIAATNGEGRLTRNSVFGMLSRVYLYTGQWQLAIDAANEVTTPIATAAQLAGVFLDANNAGIVTEWALNTTTQAAAANVGVLYSQTVATNVRSEYAVDLAFFNSIAQDDIRKTIFIFQGTQDGNTYNAVRKFRGETGQVNGRLDIKVMRAEEVLLNKAEAQFKLNRQAEALTTLNLLRAERFTNFVPGTETGAALEAAINSNRRIELSFEGHRFFDIKRNGLPITRSTFGDIADGTGTPAEIMTIPAGDPRFQLPIPIDQTNANPNFAQNPGY